MDNAHAMRSLHAATNLPHDSHSPLYIHALFVAQHVGQGLAAEIFEHQEQIARIGLAELQDMGNMIALDLGGGPRFPQKARDRFCTLVARPEKAVAYHLDRHRPAQRFVDRAIHHAHPALSHF
jgi:hypothetical protein